MKRKLLGIVLFCLLVGISVACQPATAVPPLPENVAQATLANFRPLTDSGRAIGPVWSPDGKTIAYTELSFVPIPYAYRYSNQVPETRVCIAQEEGKAKHCSAEGVALFFSRDGSQLYYLSYAPLNPGEYPFASLVALNPATARSRTLLPPQSIGSVHMLSDGRLVVSEAGTYAPLRLYDPISGQARSLMESHPWNDPEDARLSPDGTLLAYPKAQEVYLSQPDGANPKRLSEGGGFSARVWWSPNSQYLAYTSGNHWTDRLLLADREGQALAVLIPKLEESGYISSLAWSPDSRWLLVATDPYDQYTRPTRLYLFDRAGNRKLLLETYLASSPFDPAWSPDGRTLALAIGNGTEADRPACDIWLADFTDEQTAAGLPPAPTVLPAPTPARPPADLPPEAVIRRFWEAINAKDYRTAWGMLAGAPLGAPKWVDFRADFECVDQVSVEAIQPVGGGENDRVFSMQLNFQADCNEMWRAPQPYAVLMRETSDEPWLIACFNSTPDCEYRGP
ncbi:MAG: TolB family protein [Anaerolineae bacterium]